MAWQNIISFFLRDKDEDIVFIVLFFRTLLRFSSSGCVVKLGHLPLLNVLLDSKDKTVVFAYLLVFACVRLCAYRLIELSPSVLYNVTFKALTACKPH